MSFLSLLAYSSNNDIEAKISAFSLRSVLVASLILSVLLVVSSKLIRKKKHKTLKKPLFIFAALTIIFPTLLMTGSTVYINTISDSKGPIHWRTDVEFWVCGQEIELRNPSGLFNNKIGSNAFHERDDKRIHLKGIVVDAEYDASLKKFLDITEGEITDSKLVIPTEKEVFENDTDGDQSADNQTLVQSFLSYDKEQKASLTVENGDSCTGEDGYAEIQAFVYKLDEDNNTYSQTKLSNPENYTLHEESSASPGECLIVEFDIVKNRTDKLCRQYGEIDFEKCLHFGLENFDPNICRVHEVRNENFQPIIPVEAL